MIERLNQSGFVSGRQKTQHSPSASTGTFGDLLRQRLESVGTEQKPATIEFSKHAQMRAEERGIQMNDELLNRLSTSVELANAKGAKNILVFDTGRAFIVNVPQNRVVTAISQQEMQDNVFTNIDGAVLLK